MATTKINPKNYFSREILDYPVQTKKLGRVSYVNLDNAATTPPFQSVQDGINKYLIGYGSVHRGAGIKSKISTATYEQSRKIIKEIVNAPKDSYVIFTENTTGAMNAAAYFFVFLKGKIAVSAIEHSSSWLPWIKSEGIKAICRQNTIKDMGKINKQIQILGRKKVLQYDINDNFEFDLNDLEKILKHNHIKAVVLTAASNVTGYCPDIPKISKLAHKYGAFLIVDACQYIQHHQINMQKMGIDFIVASGHKFYAPYGGGFLIGPKSFLDNFLPYQIGGGNLPYITKEGEFLRYKNQQAHDPGTPNAVGAVAMAIALKKLKSIGINKIENYEKKLTQKLFDYLMTNPKVEVYINRKNLTTVLPFNIKGKNARQVAETLNRDYGIGVRAGSFCAYEIIRKIMKITDESNIIASVKKGKGNKIPALVRASIGLCTREKDIERMIYAIKQLTS